MSRVFDCIITPGNEGIFLADPTGELRNCYPLYAGHLADNPEQCLISCVPKRRSPVTTAGYHDLDSPHRFPSRTKATTLDLLSTLLKPTARKSEESLAAYVKRCRKHNSNGVTKPFWAKFPHSDPSTFLVSDVLHQLHKFFIDHPFKWFQTLIGATELDKRIAAVQRIVGLKHFNAISEISQWSGTEQRQLQKIFLACCAGAPGVTPASIRLLRSILDIIYMAQLPVHTDDTCEVLLADIQSFHHKKDEMVRLRNERGNPKSPRNVKIPGLPKHFRLPKVEMFHNLVHSIRLLGSLPQYSTEITEHLHGIEVKGPFRQGNGRNSSNGMCRFLDRREKVLNFEEYLIWRSDYSDDNRGEAPSCPNADDSAELSLLSSGISIYKKPSISRMTVDEAALMYGIADLRPALADFYMIDPDISRASRGKRRISRPNAELPFEHIDIWYQLRLKSSQSLSDHDDMTAETVCATPPTEEAPFGHCNTVLALGGANDPLSPLDGTS
jgi:hypothetical protein